MAGGDSVLNLNTVIYICLSLAVTVLVLGAAGALRRRPGWRVGTRPGENEIFRAAAGALGLRFVRGGFLSPPRILGEMEGMPAFAGRTAMRDAVTRYTVNEMSLRYDLPVKGKIFIVTRGSIAPLKSLGPDLAEMQTGDYAFDAAMETGYTGDGSNAAALLGGDARRAILELAGSAWHLRVSKSSIHYYDKRGFPDAEAMVSGFRRMAALAELLFREGDTRGMLLRNIRQDPVPAVRARNLHVLVETYPRDSEVQALLEECLRDGDEQVRIVAAALLKGRG
jgi:hypothetical protein